MAITPKDIDSARTKTENNINKGVINKWNLIF